MDHTWLSTLCKPHSFKKRTLLKRFLSWLKLNDNESDWQPANLNMHSGQEKKCVLLKGSYDAYLKIIILCIWCNRICWHALMFKKHIIFKTMYIIVGPLCPALPSNASFSTNSLLPTSTVCSDWPTDTVRCDWPNTTSHVGNVTSLSIIASFSFQN